MKENDALHELFKTLFILTGKYHCPGKKISDFSIQMEKDGLAKIIIKKNNKEYFIKEYASAWILLSGKFWGIIDQNSDGMTKTMMQILDKNLAIIKSRKLNTNISTDIQISEFLIEIGNYFLEKGNKIIAEEFFWASIEDSLYKTFESLLPKIPKYLQSDFRKAFDGEEIQEAIWGGRKAMSKITGIKSIYSVSKNYKKFYYQSSLLDDIERTFAISGSFPSYQAGVEIDTVIKDYVVPFYNGRIGILKQKACEILEYWILDMFKDYCYSEKNKNNLYFYERVLDYIQLITNNCISMEPFWLMKWEALLAMGKKVETNQIWDLFSHYLKGEDIAIGNGFVSGDKIDYRAATQAKVVIILSRIKKISEDQKKYMLELAMEAFELVRNKIDAPMQKKKSKGEEVFHPKMKYEDIYYALYLSYKMNGLLTEAYEYLKKADHFSRKYSTKWRKDRFVEELINFESKN